jgi:hypothetical protein
VRELPNTIALQGLSIPSKIDIDQEGKNALFELLMDDEMRPDDEGPPSAIFLIDITTGGIRRVTPKGISATHPTWLRESGHYLFAAFDQKLSSFSIYRAKIDGSEEPEMLIQNAGSPAF